jgi:hypothetical protein
MRGLHDKMIVDKCILISILYYKKEKCEKALDWMGAEKNKKKVIKEVDRLKNLILALEGKKIPQLTFYQKIIRYLGGEEYGESSP